MQTMYMGYKAHRKGPNDSEILFGPLLPPIWHPTMTKEVQDIPGIFFINFFFLFTKCLFAISSLKMTFLCKTRRVVINNPKGCNEIKLTKRVVFRTVVFTTFIIIKKIPPISDVFYDTKFLKKITTFEY